MPMKNPAHPGALIKDDIDALGLSVAEAARGLGIVEQQLQRVINGTSAVTPEMAIRLEQAIGGSAETWLRMQANYDLAKIRARSPDITVPRLEPKAA